MKTLMFTLAALVYLQTAPAIAATSPDNTAINARDRNANELTADDQKMNQQDTNTTQRIRKALVKDKRLSTNAKNVKIITANGQVTLKGVVNTAKEKNIVLREANRVAGKSKVINEITVTKRSE